MHLGLKVGANAEGKFQLFAYADAAYGVHPDAKSHSGIFSLSEEDQFTSSLANKNVLLEVHVRPSS